VTSSMSGKRIALLVGCSQYEDSTFPPLRAPAQDVEALARVLADPAIGNFTVEKLLNKPAEEIREKIEGFFADSKPDDLLLLYFSCHGDLDSRGRLYFVATNTKRERPRALGITTQWVKDQMYESRSQRIVLLLDCCYSGAFAARGGAGGSEILEQVRQLAGRGRIVITASGKREEAFESFFTNAVVHGLETGEADLDGDGHVSVVELYQYVYREVSQGKANQKPTMSGEIQGPLYLANNPRALLPLPDELKSDSTSETVWKRRGAVDGLERLLAGDHPVEQKRTARQALAALCHDPDPGVAKAARSATRRVSWSPHRNRWLAVFGLGIVVVLLAGALTWWGSGGPLPGASAVPPDNSPCVPSVKSADGVLSLGTLLPKTGAFVYTGPPLDAGVRLAMKDINDAGGIPGIAVTLDEANRRDEGNPTADTARQSTDALLAGGVDAIIGPGTSPVALKVIDKITCSGVIIFAPSNTSPVFTTYPDHGLYFRTAPSSDLAGAVLGKLIAADGNSTAVVMSRDDTYGNHLREATVKAIQESKGQVLDSFHYDPNVLDYSNEIKRIKAKNSDAIVLIGFTESARILAKMIEEGLGPRSKRVYGVEANTTNTLAGQVSPRDPSALAGIKGIRPYDGDEVFVKRLREINPTLRDLTYAAQAYDAVVVTALAAAVAGTDEPAAIAKEINGVTKNGEKCTSFAACMTLVKDHKNIDYDGPSGPLEFTAPGEPCSVTYVISEIQADGTVKSLRSERVGC
jgi:ABC-type branched-subunit amino acid transport system substrate-binding protein